MYPLELNIKQSILDHVIPRAILAAAASNRNVLRRRSSASAYRTCTALSPAASLLLVGTGLV